MSCWNVLVLTHRRCYMAGDIASADTSPGRCTLACWSCVLLHPEAQQSCRETVDWFVLLPIGSPRFSTCGPCMHLSSALDGHDDPANALERHHSLFRTAAEALQTDVLARVTRPHDPMTRQCCLLLTGCGDIRSRSLMAGRSLRGSAALWTIRTAVACPAAAARRPL